MPRTSQDARGPRARGWLWITVRLATAGSAAFFLGQAVPGAQPAAVAQAGKLVMMANGAPARSASEVRRP